MSVAEGWNGPVSRVGVKTLDVRVREGQYLMDIDVQAAVENQDKEMVKVDKETMMDRYEVVLKNNRKHYAESADGEIFNVLMSDDKFRVYALTSLKSIAVIPTDEDEEMAVSNQILVNTEKDKEEGMKIYHFLREMADAHEGKQLVRIVATHLLPGELEAYEASINQNIVSRTVRGDLLLALKTGEWKHVLLQKRLADKNIDFRLMSVDHDSLGALGRTSEFMDLSTFAWADADHTQFLKVYNSTVDWGLQDLGLVGFNTKKISKRLKEVSRQTHWHFYTENVDDINIHVFESDDSVHHFDGMNSISRAFANKMGVPKNVYRLNIRILTAAGVLKGDSIVNNTQRQDVITYAENIKGDLKTTGGWVLATAFEHKPYHFSVWDDQSMINNKALLPEKHQVRDIDTLIQNVRDAVNSGNLPSWLDLGEEAHTDSAVPAMDQLSDRLHANYVRWQVNGFDIRAAQNLIFMGINGIINRMNSSIERKKMWLPISNAFTGSVNTYESLTEMCRISLPRSKKDLVFFDKRYGVVIPGKRFIETFDLHGTWDLDDTAKFILIKLWSSSNDITEIHRGGMTISQDMFVPSNQEDAVLCVAVIRSPNGPGEFSIEMIDEESMLPMFHNLDMENITTVDLVKCALPQSVLLTDVVVNGMETTVVYNKDDEFNSDHAKLMIKAQMINPTIGNICNALMTWSNAFGPSFPSKMLEVLGEMVDATQQGADIRQFEQITAEVKSIYSQFIDKLMATPGARVDTYLLEQRPIMAEFAEKIPQSRLVKGRLHRVYKKYNEAISVLYTEIRQQSLQMRQATPLVQHVRAMVLGNDARAFADKFQQKFNARVGNVDKSFQNNPEYHAIMAYAKDGKNNDARVFVEKMVGQMKAEEMSKVVAEMVQTLRSTGEDCNRLTLGLYKFLVSPVKGKPLGQFDRIVFQPGNKGQINVMDLLIEALKNV